MQTFAKGDYIVAGAAAGLVIGTAVPLLHRRGGARVTLVPAPGGLAIAL